MTDIEIICTIHWIWLKLELGFYVKLSNKSTRIKNNHTIQMFASRTDTEICDIWLCNTMLNVFKRNFC